MKRVFITIVLILNVLSISAQNEGNKPLSIQNAIDACINLRDAVANNDTTGIRQSANRLQKLNMDYFDGLECLDDTDASLDGHLVFDENFAKAIINDRNAFERADDINRESVTVRGQNSDGSISTKSCFVKAKGNTKYTFLARGYQELAVVAESGGLVTMKIHVTNRAGLDEHHDDIKDVAKGQSYRKTSFELPTKYSNLVELVVFNCGDKDISFVVISN